MAKSDKAALFIDGANLYLTSRSVGFDVDFRKLLAYFKIKTRLIRAFYFTAIPEEGEHAVIRPLIDWLEYNSYSIISKPAKEFTDAYGRRKIKGNMVVDIAVQAMQIAPYIDHIILFSGDGDLRCLVEAVQKKGVFVTVVSSIASHPPVLADELRRQANEFIELASLKSELGRDAAGLPPR